MTTTGLSIDAGGIRGYMTLKMIDFIEKESGLAAYQIFDIISGTSVGGKIAALLASGYTAKNVIEMYDQHAGMFFEKKPFRFQIFRSKYDDEYMNGILKSYLGDSIMSDARTGLLIPIYNTDTNSVVICKSHGSTSGLSMFDVVRSTIAAPTYIPQWEIAGNKFSDGGLHAPNPADYCYAEMKDMSSKKVSLLSLGTGIIEKPVKNGSGGFIFWIKPASSIQLKESIKKTNNILERIVTPENGTFTRCDIKVNKSSGEMDDASPKNMKAMAEDALLSLRMNRQVLKSFIAKIA
jgi:patatin-like phospholipase/acyl hydrolase